MKKAEKLLKQKYVALKIFVINLDEENRKVGGSETSTELSLPSGMKLCVGAKAIQNANKLIVLLTV